MFYLLGRNPSPELQAPILKVINHHLQILHLLKILQKVNKTLEKPKKQQKNNISKIFQNPSNKNKNLFSYLLSIPIIVDHRPFMFPRLLRLRKTQFRNPPQIVIPSKVPYPIHSASGPSRRPLASHRNFRPSVRFVLGFLMPGDQRPPLLVIRHRSGEQSLKIVKKFILKVCPKNRFLAEIFGLKGAGAYRV